MRLRRSLLLHAAALALLLAGPAGASAAAPNLNTVVTDGEVDVTVFDDAGRAYLGGYFTRTGPRLGNGIAVTSSSDTPAGGFPEINGQVNAAVSDGAGGWFVGGSFTAVGGVTRNRLAHIRADRTLDPDWNPGANNTVYALALSTSGASVYVGGNFHGANAIAGQFRSRLAKLSATGTGAMDPAWRINVGGFSVRAIAVSGTAVYIGGEFNSVDEFDPADDSNTFSPRMNLAKVAGSDGTLDQTWDPSASGGVEVTSLAVSGAHVFVGGQFSAIGGQTRFHLAKVASTGTGSADATWNPNLPLPVTALQLTDAGLFAGSELGLFKVATTGTGAIDPGWTAQPVGEVNSLGLVGGELLVGGEFTEVGASERYNLARLTTANPGVVTGWKPNPFGPVHALATSGSDVFVGGDFPSAGPAHEFRGGLIRLNANGTLDESFDPEVDGRVQSLALDGSILFVGGSFNRVKGQTRHSLAKVGTAGGAVDSAWNPGTTGPVRALAVSGTRLFVGGDFSGPDSIGGENRQYVAKLSTSGAGAVEPTWDPVPDAAIRALAVSGEELFAAGQFFVIGGENTGTLAKLSTEGAGAADPNWRPDPIGYVDALALSGSSVYAGGDFPGRIDKFARTGAGSSDPAWTATASNNVRALALSGDALYVAGAFSIIGGQARNRMARLSAATGAPDPGFNPGASTNGGPVNAIAATGNRVVAGGMFRSIGTRAIASLAVFNLGTPTVAVSSPAVGARFRLGQEVSAGYSCSDPDGPADSLECSGNVPSGAAIDTGGTGAKTFTVTARDAAGNTATTTVDYTVDGTPPSISIASPADGASYAPGTNVAVDYACVAFDVIDDVASCAGTSPVGTQLDTVTPGPHTFTVTATDKVGNVGVKTVAYTVTAAGASNGDDILDGSAAADTICGLFGNDRINGLAGNDRLFGDNCNDKSRPIVGAQSTTEGSDRINGGDGDDTIHGAGGKDTLKGDKGADKLFGGGGNDSLAGGDGNDTLDGGKGRDTLDGGKGNDKLTGGPDVDKYLGGAGNDAVNAKNGKVETVDCGAGKKDSASVDRRDRVKGCEKVKRATK